MTSSHVPRRTLPFWATAALGAALLSATAKTFAAADAWTEARGTDFRLIGHSSPDRLRNVACDLERVSRALQSMRPVATPFTTPVVIAAADEHDMRGLLPQYWEQRGARPVGAYWAGAFGHHIVVRIDAPPRERFRRILHEYAHFATHVSGSEPPRWLDEGLSELWTHAAFDSTGIVLGRPVKQHLSALRSDANWIPVRDLASATELPAPGNRKRVASFYAESWALVHYLVAGQPGGLRNVRSVTVAGLPTDEVLRGYIQSRHLPSLTIPSQGAAMSCDAPAQTLPLSESVLLRSRAMSDSPRPMAAEALLRPELAKEPVDPRALEVSGLVHFLENRPVQAENAFNLALASGMATHVAYYYRALLATPPDAELLRRALQLTPDFQPAKDRLAELQSRP